MRKLIRSLIVPYIIFAIVGILCEMLMSLLGYKSASLRGGISQIFYIGAPWWNFPIWFLLSLFFVKIITSFYSGTGSSTIIFMVIGLGMSMFHYHLLGDRFNYIGNTGLGLLFYVIGSYSKNLRLKDLHYILIGLLFLAVLLIFPVAIDLFGNSTLYGNYYQAILAVILGMVIINKIFEISKFLQVKPLVFFGQNAMVFILFHVPIAMITRTLFTYYTELTDTMINWIEAMIAIPICVGICILVDRFKI